MNTPMSVAHRNLRALVVAAVALAVAPLGAHDMWIEPASFWPDAGQIVGVQLRVGQDLLGDPLPRDPRLIREFVVDDGTERKALVGRDGADPAGFFRVATPGFLIVGYHSHPTAIDETAEKFNQYLKEEGLDAVAALRAKRGETGSKTREIFSRCAKSLVMSGSPNAAQGDRALGFTLELIAERNPYTVLGDEDLPVRLSYENRPLSGTLVVAMNRSNPAQKLAARTDNAGRVRFRLKTSGMWLIKAVHMVEAPAGSGAEWASYWASLTFELKESPGRTQ
jgi:uncharacterized GH25 family protein